MLFCYPIQATNDNWLHDCLVGMLLNGLSALNDGKQPTAWPKCIPDARREALKAKTSLRDRLKKFWKTAAGLDNDQRKNLVEAIQSQNNMPQIFDDNVEYINSATITPEMMEASKSLFQKAFELLTDLGIRDSHYQYIYDQMTPQKICPFCGFEPFDAPGAPRHALDHYLPISIYPFAGVNLLNLVPSGDRCNSSYKRTKDILNEPGNLRTACFDPYGQEFSTISLAGSRMFMRELGKKPDWDIEITGGKKATTWDRVWSIKERYVRDVLDPNFDGWLQSFAQWLILSGKPKATSEDVTKALEAYVNTVVKVDFGTHVFLKLEAFKFMAASAISPADNGRTARFLMSVVSNVALQ